jgi:hypothetical protein
VKRLVLVLAFAAACGGDDDAVAPDAFPLEPTFASLRANVFGPKCAAPCHSAIDPPGGLDLATDPYAALVGVDAAGRFCRDMGLVRVVPGDAAASLAYQKIIAKRDDTDPVCGEGMPQGSRPALSDDEIAAIEQWIADGAMP